jgi:alcohol dehydrogenase
MSPEGRLVVYGAADFMPSTSRPNYLRLAMQYVRRPRLDPVQMIADNRSVMGFNLIWLWDRADRLPEAFAEASALIRTKPHIGATFSFADVPRAMRTLQSGATVGKVVVVP